MSLKKFLKAGVAVLMATLMSVQAYAATLSVGLRDNRPIDIILAAGETKYDLDQFESRMRTALGNAGVDMNRVKIQAVESTNSAAITNFPWIRTGETRKVLIESGGNITIQGDARLGYWAGVTYSPPDMSKVTKFSAEFTLDPSNSIPHTISTASFYVAGFRFYLTATSSSRSPVPWDVNLNGYGLNKFLGRISVGSSARFRIEVTKTQVDVYMNGSRIVSQPVSNVLMDKMELTVDHDSHACSILSSFKLTNVIVETQVAKDLVEVVRAPDWRPDSHRFVVDVNDVVRKDFDTSDKVTELIQRMLKDGAYYVGLGTTANRNQMNNFVSGNGGNGFVRTNTEDANLQQTANWMAPIVNKLINKPGRQYVLVNNELAITNAKDLDNSTSTVYPDGRWLTNYSKTYSESGVSLTFENVAEAPFWTNRRQKQFTFSTSAIGYFTNLYEEAQVSPYEIIVHQRPVSSLNNMVLKDAGSTVTLVLDAKSYDPDFYDPQTLKGRADKGIKSYSYTLRYAGLNTTVVSSYSGNGNPATISIPGLIRGREYELEYNVYDYQGSSGNPVVKYINTNSSDRSIKPIADFTISTAKISIYNWDRLVDGGRSNDFTSVLQDLSYDPYGDKLSSYTWTWYKSDSEVPVLTYKYAPGSRNPNEFAEFLKYPSKTGKGTYYLGLVVARGSGEANTSALYKRVMEITREPYALWFTDMYKNTAEIGLSTPIATPPEYVMKGFNKDSITFHNNKRVITFNALKGNPFVTTTYKYQVSDPTPVTRNKQIKEYPLTLNQKFVWPVTQTQINGKESMFAVWGTPTNDWAFVPSNMVGTGAGAYQGYIRGTQADYFKSVLPWGYDFSNYVLLSTTEEETYRLSAVIPDNWVTADKVYVKELNTSVYDWITNTYIPMQPNIYRTGNQFNITVPSTASKITVTGFADTNTLITGSGTKHRVGGTYFKDLPRENTTVNTTKEGFSETGESKPVTMNLPDKGKNYAKYFYVMPETSKITGESYVDKRPNTSSYEGTVWASASYKLNIRRQNDNAQLKVDGQLMDTQSRSFKYLDNRRSTSFQLATVDSLSEILGYRLNGAESWTWVKSNNLNLTIPINRENSTVEIMVRAEDRAIQQVYKLNISVPNTYDALGATVKYHTLTTNQTYTGIYDVASSTYTITLPENVRTGKLEVTTTNDTSIVEKLNKVGYNTNSVTVDYELPYHTNPSGNFTIKSKENGKKSYVVKFVKQNSAPEITLLNGANLTGVFSPQGKYVPATDVYTPYASLTASGSAFTGNGIPIEVKVKNKEHVQGVRATVKFNNFDFEVHWGSYDGATYTDGKTELTGYAVISKEAVAGLNGSAVIDCVVYDFDYANSSAVSESKMTLTTIKCDSTGPIASHTASSATGPQIRFTGVQDVGSKTLELYMEYGPEEMAGYNQSTSIDIKGIPAFTVPLNGVTGPQRFKVVLKDVLQNTTTLEFNYDFSDVDGTDVYMEFGRNSDGYYIGVRKPDDTKLGIEQFDFIS